MRPNPRPKRRPNLILLAALISALGAPGARAQEAYSYTVSLLGGVGGSFDADPDPGAGNRVFQAGFAVITEPRTHVGLRVGRLAVESGELLGSLREPELDYATLGAEYRIQKSYYDSGLLLGLGAYRLRGDDALFGDEREDTAVGAMAGVSGEFHINRHLGFVIELTAHYADLDEQSVFAWGLAGLALHF